MITIICEQCGDPFDAYPSAKRRYCSPSCATTARNLTDANPAYHRDISGDKNPMFGVKRSGADNPMYGKRKEAAPRWTGGRRVRKDGYVIIIAPDGHPYPSETKPSGTKYMLEHRAIMEDYLDRYLHPDEVVHHIDNNPSNNMLENLQLFANQSEHISVGHAIRE